MGLGDMVRWDLYDRFINKSINVRVSRVGTVG